MFSKTKLHAILVSETWLNQSILSSSVSIDNFNLFRNDRVEKKGGGVAIFIKKSLKARIVEASYNSVIEYIAVEVASDSDKCLLIAVYCPPNLFSLENMDIFESHLEKWSKIYRNIIVGGDWNVNLMNSTSLSNTFLHSLQRFNLSVINNSPTYFNTSNPSLLDLFLVSDQSAVVSFNQISPPSFLDHDIIFLTYDFPVAASNKPKSFYFRDLSKINIALLNEDCESMEWNKIYYMASVDEQVDFLNNHIKFLYQKHVPVKQKTLRDNYYPWFSKEVKVLIAEREYLFRKYKKEKSIEVHLAYKKVRNKINLLIRSLKRAYYTSKLKPNLTSRELWANLRQLGVYGKDNRHNVCGFSPDALNTQFLASSCNSSTHDDNLSLFQVHTHSTISEFNFKFRCVDSNEVVNAVFSIKSSAIGIDQIHPRFIKIILPYILSPLTHIYNSCFTFCVYPSLWKIASITPIPKKPGCKELSDYRPISIICFLSKVLEKLIYNQIVLYVNKQNLLSQWQSGFRCSHSCETALLRVTTDIREMLDKNQLAILCLLDFSKAFDSITHSYLLEKLNKTYSFSSTSIALINSFLNNRQQCVKLKNEYSSIASVKRGVPQGSILGPLFFSLFINDLADCVNYSYIHLYADDVQLYLMLERENLPEYVNKLNSDLDSIWKWSLKNGLMLNPLKSQCMIVSNSVQKCDFPPIVINGVKLDIKSKVKNLGVVLNSRMSCCDYVQNMLNKVYMSLRSLRLTTNYLSTELRLKLVRALIIPHFLYGNVIFPSLDFTCRYKVAIAFNDCIRYVYQLPRYAHVSSFECSILGCTLINYLQYRSMLTFHRIIYTAKPIYLNKFIALLGTSRHLMVRVPRFRRLIGERSYFVQTSRLWNGLPSVIQRTGSYNSFKRLLWTYFVPDQNNTNRVGNKQ